MMTAHPVATAWLDRVDRLAIGLPEPRRRELLADLADHLDTALGSNPTDAEVDGVLDRMGDPADIVAAASEEEPSRSIDPPGPPPPPAPARSDTADATSSAPHSLTGWEIAVLAGLALSGLLVLVFVVAVPLWIVAVVLLFTRTRWVGAERLVGLLVPLGFAVLLTMPLLSWSTDMWSCETTQADGVVTETCRDAAGDVVDPDAVSGPDWGAIAGLALPPLASTAGMVWMSRRVRGRPA